MECIEVSRVEMERLLEERDIIISSLTNEVARLSQQSQVDWEGEYKKLEKDNETMKKALTEIKGIKRRLEQTTDFGVGFQTNNNALEFAVVESEKALAAIGGDDE